MPYACRAALAGLLACSAATGQATGDNVLLLVADDLGVDAVGAYAEGSNPPPTPHLDALAARGVLFRNAWSNPACSPTRACLHTGRHALRTLIGNYLPPGSAAGLPLDEITLPEALDRGSSGRAHALIGKWHLGAETALAPNAAGWSHFAGLLEGYADYYSWLRTVNGVSAVSSTYATSAIVDDALSWIGQQRRPWVCCVAFTAPHSPFHAPPAHLHSQNLAGRVPELDPVPFFRAMVEAMDNELGRLLAALGPALERTHVIFVGDNGTHAQVSLPPFSPYHAKGTPYEGGINVPLIAAGPAVRSPGREERALVSAVDLFATVLELAGVDARAVIPHWVALDAVSAVPYLAHLGHPPRRGSVLAEQFDGFEWASVNTTGFAAIRDDRFKVIRYYGAWRREELYDLAADPFETLNLLAAPLSELARHRHAALTAELERLRNPEGGLYPFGTTGCAGSGGNPALGGIGRPAIGRAYAIHLANGAALAPAALLCGASASTWGPWALPLPLAPIGGGPGCWLYASGELALPVLTDPSGRAAVSLPVPFDPDAVGRTVFHAWVSWDPAAPNNALGLTTSDAVAAVIGT